MHIKESLNEEIKRLATDEHKSESILVGESVEFDIKEKKRKAIGNKVLELVGKVKVDPDAERCLDEGKHEHDRT